jgi:hypothetical protein
MLKKLFMAAIVGLIICAGVKAEASDSYVGKSDSTGWVCYIMTDTIECHWEGNMAISKATLKMRDEYGNPHYLDYTFYDYQGKGADLRFENSQGYNGEVNPYDTPIEWGMYEVIRKYY